MLLGMMALLVVRSAVTLSGRGLVILHQLQLARIAAMHITLRPDANLPDNRLHVADDLDDELMTALLDCAFEVVVDEAQSPGSIRLSVPLAARLDEWLLLDRLRGA